MSARGRLVLVLVLLAPLNLLLKRRPEDLGLEPDGDDLACDPHLPESIRSLSLTGVRGRWGEADAVATRETVSITAKT